MHYGLLKSLYKGLSIYSKNYQDLVRDIEKQDKILTNKNIAEYRPEGREETYNYLQRLLNLHREFFPAFISTIIAVIALVLSLISLFVSINKR